MVTQVTLGNFFNTNGRTVLAGVGGSGLDTESLIKGLAEAKRAPAVEYEKQLTQNGKVSKALTEFKDLLSVYNSALDALRNPPGVGNEADNVFKYRTSTVTASDGTTASNYLTVTASPGAAVQNYTINRIEQLATAASQSTGTITATDANTTVVTAGATAGRFKAGTISLGSQYIELEVGDSLNDIASKFNAVSTNTGIRATLVQISTNDFQLSFSATATGESGDFDLSSIAVDPDGVFDNVSMSSAQGGQNARFYLNGIATAIERETNNIDDVINGLTFNLRATFNVANNPAVKLNADIAPDVVLAQNSIITFINAYNELRVFAAKQTQIDSDGTYAEDAILANNQTFTNTMAEISRQVSAAVPGLSGSPSSLAELGVTLVTIPANEEDPAVSNILSTNDSKIKSALESNFDAVSRLFGFNLTSDNTNLRVFSYTNALSLNEFELDIDPGNDVFTATYNDGAGNVTVNLTATLIPGIGYTLKGLSGTPLDGLELIYGSLSSATIEVRATQGIAAQAFNTSSAAIKDNTGTIAIALESLADNSAKIEEDIANIDTQVTAYRERLIKQFSALEQTISNVNNLLQSLTANDEARASASG